MTKKVTKAKVIKLELNEVLILNQELRQLSRESAINFVIKYQLIALFEKTNRLVKNYNETRLKIVKKYGKIDEGKNLFNIL